MNNKPNKRNVPINKLTASERMEAMRHAIKNAHRIAPSSESIAVGNKFICIKGNK